MYPLIVAFAVLSTIGLTMLALAFRSAPEGFEDSKGFHPSKPEDRTMAPPADAGVGVRELLFLEQSRASQPWS